jgi:hypothetical protein
MLDHSQIEWSSIHVHYHLLYFEAVLLPLPNVNLPNVLPSYGFQPEKRHIGEVYCGHSAETPIIFSKQLSPRPAEPGAQLHQERGLDDLWPRSHREYQRGGGSGECVLFCSNYYRLLLCAPGAINSQPGDSSQNIFGITLWWLG